jgi:hypothetical protein
MTMKDDTTKAAGKKNNGASPPATTAPAGAAGAAAPAAAAATVPAGTAMTSPPETQALEVFEYGDDAGQGFENQDMSDRKLPLIELLQSNSPAVAESKGKIWAGQFRNTVTGEICDEVFFTPAITDHCWTEWVPRDDGGGFRGRHRKDAKTVAEAVARNGGRAIGKLPVPQPADPKTGKAVPTHELVESFEIYCIIYDPKTNEVLGFAMIPFTSTKIKVYRAWNSAIGNFAPTINGKKLAPGSVPIFAHRVKMTSESETKGPNTFMVPVLSPAEGGDDLKTSLLPKTDPRYAASKKLHDDVLAGLAKAAYETTTQDPGVDPESGVPF